MKILISAAEASSDVHGAELLKALKKELGPEVPLYSFGVGGAHLQAAGLETVVDAKDLLVMGFVEILGHLPKIFRSLNKVVQAAVQSRPDVAVVLDYPEFHFRLAQRLKHMGVPVVYYIPPKLWVWRKKRAKALKKLFHKILCIFPFEQAFYEKLNVPVTYIGNPLIDELPLSLSVVEARQQVSLDESDRVLVVMIGSRESEWKHHLEIFLDTANLLSEKLRALGQLGTDETLKILMPFPMTSPIESLKVRVAQWAQKKDPSGKSLEIRISQGDSAVCLVAADAGLIKSGTSTLEAALLQCPHVIAYKPGVTSGFIFKHLIRYQGPVGLVNLVSGWSAGQPYLVSEYLCEAVKPESMAQELVSLISPTEKCATMMQGFNRLIKLMQSPDATVSPSVLAAREIIALVKSQPIRE